MKAQQTSRRFAKHYLQAWWWIVDRQPSNRRCCTREKKMMMMKTITTDSIFLEYILRLEFYSRFIFMYNLHDLRRSFPIAFLLLCGKFTISWHGVMTTMLKYYKIWGEDFHKANDELHLTMRMTFASSEHTHSLDALSYERHCCKISLRDATHEKIGHFIVNTR